MLEDGSTDPRAGTAEPTLLIAGADIYCCGTRDLRVRGDRVTEIGALRPAPGESVVHARGGALLPGLNDHHIHLLSCAAARASLACGPPAIADAQALRQLLRGHAADPGGRWLRGIGYHESVAGDIDRHWLDACVADRPVRIQHRSGRLWIVNSAGLADIASKRPAGRLAAAVARADGRLYDLDRELGELLGLTLPPVAEVSAQLAALGVTGITDMTPQNSTATAALLGGLAADGSLRQRLLLAGQPELKVPRSGGVVLGPTKVHLHETGLPPFDAHCEVLRKSHQGSRVVAVHCVTETELVFALAGFTEVGVLPGDRIEHAAVTPPALLEALAELGLAVVTQPHFIAERGDAYLRDVPAAEQPWLYRCRGFLEAGVPLAAGSDAPFGSADPWLAMRSAVNRRTAGGSMMSVEEALDPEQALELFLGSLERPCEPRRIAVGAPADLMLLDRPWSEARSVLRGELVRLTLNGGKVIFDRDRRFDRAPASGPVLGDG